MKKVIAGMILGVVIAVGILFSASGSWFNMTNIVTHSQASPDIDSRFIDNKLQLASDLTSAEMIYNGIIEYSDGDIPFINHKAFLMTYRAEVKAGIDLEDIDVKLTDAKVKLYIPEVEIQNIIIDTTSIKFYDEKSSIFNHQDNNDVVDAIEVAKEDVKENGDLRTLKKKAEEQIDRLMHGLFDDVIGDRVLVIEFD